jgi:plastocyanin
MMTVCLSLVACTGDPRTMGKTEIQTSIAEDHFYPQKWIVPSGQYITITFEIPDGTEHLFAVLKNQIPGGMDLSEENIFWSVPLSGSHFTTSFQAPAMPGEYIVTCLIPGHSEKGENGQLIVVIPYSSTAQ